SVHVPAERCCEHVAGVRDSGAGGRTGLHNEDSVNFETALIRERPCSESRGRLLSRMSLCASTRTPSPSDSADNSAVCRFCQGTLLHLQREVNSVGGISGSYAIRT